MPTPAFDPAALAAVADALADGGSVSPPEVAAAVRGSLAQLAALHPGRLVEVRVPPWGAVQVGAPGSRAVHRRGTPPNVVQTDPATWLALATGRLTWADARAAHRIEASGVHADLAAHLPLDPPPDAELTGSPQV